jgi:hypothetical protein
VLKCNQQEEEIKKLKIANIDFQNEITEQLKNLKNEN